MLYVRFVIKDAPYKTNKQRNNSDHWKLLIKNLIMEITNKKTLPALYVHNTSFILNCFQTSCVDINECELNPDTCGQGECVNIEGGFECVCPIGYVLSPDGQVR